MRAGFTDRLFCLKMTTLNFDLTLGPFFWGTVIVFMLYGVTTAQTAFFFRSKLGDKGTFKALILFLWTIDTFHFIAVTIVVYHYLVGEAKNVLGLLSIYWGLVASIVATVTSDLIVRSIYAQRIWLLSGRSWPLLAAVVAVSLLADATGIAYGVELAKLKLFESLPSLSWLMYTSLGAAVMADTAIAGSLCVLLWKRRTSFSRTNSLVSSLMVYSIQTGLFTCICSIACIMTYALLPSTLIFMGIYSWLSKLYVNALLAYLNARMRLRNDRCGPQSVHSSRI